MDKEVERKAFTPLRLSLMAVIAAVTWSALSVIMGATSASAADGDTDSPPSLLGGLTSSLVGGVVAVVTPVVAPVVAVVPEVVAVIAPVVAVVPEVVAVVTPVLAVVPTVTHVATEVVAAVPVGSVVTPVTKIVDAVVTNVPVVGGAVGSSPLGSVTAPLITIIDLSQATITAVPAVTDVRLASSSVAFAPSSGVSSASVISQPQPFGGPLQEPFRNTIDPTVLPAQSGGNSSSGGANGSPNASAEWTRGLSMPGVTSGTLSTFGDEILPSSPAFDPGFTPA